MGREVRRVPETWEHPRDERDRYRPLFDRPFKREAEAWDDENALWQQGKHPDQLKYTECASMAFEDWSGTRPDSRDYMPDWPAAERTHYQMYENTSEGTPISPVMDSPEALARWLVDNQASAFGRQTASYEAWLRIAYGGFAPSAVMVSGGPLMSGVEAMASEPE